MSILPQNATDFNKARRRKAKAKAKAMLFTAKP